MLTFFVTIRLVAGFGSLCGNHRQPNSEAVLNGSLTASTPIPNLKVVFMGDQGLEGGVKKPRSVLETILAFAPDMVIHSGDMDYVENPSAWEEQLDSVLGSDFPYFINVGNHDLALWKRYQSLAVARLKRFGGDQFCTGEYGVNMACNYKGLLFVLSGVGTRGSNHAQFIDDTFKSVPAKWKACTWHKNQHLMQTGDKTDETGWAVYDTCRQHGALVATGHEHSYSRTHNMADFATQRLGDAGDPVVFPGQSFAFVSGLGGHEIRAWKNGLEQSPWWASTASSSNGVNFGALYCIFNVDGDTSAAQCSFDDISGKTWDKFTITSNNSEVKASSGAVSDPECYGRFLEFPITHGEQDGRVVAGQWLHSEHALPLDDGEVVFSFATSLSGADEAEIQSAYLQVYGKLSAACPVNLSVSLHGQEASAVSWQGEAEDFEAHDVWVSPDVSAFVKASLANNDRPAGEVRLSLSGVKQACALHVYSFDGSECLGATLAVQMAPKLHKPACAAL